MPKHDEFTLDMKEIFRHSVLENFLFSYVFAMKKALPGMTIKRIVQEFKKDFNLDDRVLDDDIAVQKYYRMIKDYYDSLRTDKQK